MRPAWSRACAAASCATWASPATRWRSWATGRSGPAAEPTVLVDVANVVGSRPDGWWRDRAGATSRLLTRLAGLDRDVVAVVEGRARDVPEVPGVRLVRAQGSGDDALAAEATRLGTPLVVVTADRGLRARLPAGTTVHGPGWLHDLLDRG